MGLERQSREMNPQYPEAEYALMVKYLEGSLESKERIAIEQRLKSDPQLAAEFNRVSQLWATAPKSAPTIEVDYRLAKVRVKDRIQKRVVANPPTSLRMRKTRRILSAVATILLLVLGYARWMHHQSSILTVQATQEAQLLVLPDGSEVMLASGSQVQYPRHFETANRRVVLLGTAFFRVYHKANHPFQVVGNGCQVEVLGTEFEVRTDSVATAVAVKSGSVSLSSSTSDKQIVLKAEETASYAIANDELGPKSDAPSAFYYWATDQLHFENVPLAEIILSLKEIFNHDIILDNPALGNCLVTTAFTAPTLSEVIEELKLLLNLKIKTTPNTTILDGNGCQDSVE